MGKFKERVQNYLDKKDNELRKKHIDFYCRLKNNRNNKDKKLHKVCRYIFKKVFDLSFEDITEDERKTLTENEKGEVDDKSARTSSERTQQDREDNQQNQEDAENRCRFPLCRFCNERLGKSQFPLCFQGDERYKHLLDLKFRGNDSRKAASSRSIKKSGSLVEPKPERRRSSINKEQVIKEMKKERDEREARKTIEPKTSGGKLSEKLSDYKPTLEEIPEEETEKENEELKPSSRIKESKSEVNNSPEKVKKEEEKVAESEFQGRKQPSSLETGESLLGNEKTENEKLQKVRTHFPNEISDSGLRKSYDYKYYRHVKRRRRIRRGKNRNKPSPRIMMNSDSESEIKPKDNVTSEEEKVAESEFQGRKQASLLENRDTGVKYSAGAPEENRKQETRNEQNISVDNSIPTVIKKRRNEQDLQRERKIKELLGVNEQIEPKKIIFSTSQNKSKSQNGRSESKKKNENIKVLHGKSSKKIPTEKIEEDRKWWRIPSSNRKKSKEETVSLSKKGQTESDLENIAGTLKIEELQGKKADSIPETSKSSFVSDILSKVFKRKSTKRIVRHESTQTKQKLKAKPKIVNSTSKNTLSSFLKKIKVPATSTKQDNRQLIIVEDYSAKREKRISEKGQKEPKSRRNARSRKNKKKGNKRQSSSPEIIKKRSSVKKNEKRAGSVKHKDKKSSTRQTQISSFDISREPSSEHKSVSTQFIRPTEKILISKNPPSSLAGISREPSSEHKSVSTQFIRPTEKILISKNPPSSLSGISREHSLEKQNKNRPSNQNRNKTLESRGIQSSLTGISREHSLEKQNKSKPSNQSYRNNELVSRRHSLLGTPSEYSLEKQNKKSKASNQSSRNNELVSRKHSLSGTPSEYSLEKQNKKSKASIQSSRKNTLVSRTPDSSLLGTTRESSTENKYKRGASTQTENPRNKEMVRKKSYRSLPEISREFSPEKETKIRRPTNKIIVPKNPQSSLPDISRELSQKPSAKSESGEKKIRFSKEHLIIGGKTSTGSARRKPLSILKKHNTTITKK